MVKKVLSVILPVAVIFHLFGYGIVFFVQLHMAKQQMMYYVKAEKMKDVLSFYFSKEQYEQLPLFENEEEFLWEGGMYDILSKTIINDSVHLRAYYDHKETGLLGSISRTIQSNFVDVPDAKCRIFSFALSEYCIPQCIYQHHDQCIITTFRVPSPSVGGTNACPATPPPDRCSA